MKSPPHGPWMKRMLKEFNLLGQREPPHHDMSRHVSNLVPCHWERRHEMRMQILFGGKGYCAQKMNMCPENEYAVRCNLCW